MDSMATPTTVNTLATPPYTNSTASPPQNTHDGSQGMEYDAPSVQTLADRIKSRPRRSAPVNYSASAQIVMEPRRPAPAVPQKTRARKRPAEEKEERRPTLPHLEVLGEGATVYPITVTPSPASNELRPRNDPTGNRDFVDQMIKALKIRLKPRAVCFGDRQNKRMHYLLTNATPVNDKEMLFLTGAEAAAMFKPGVFHDGPILTEGQQPLPLQCTNDFLEEYYDDDTRVFIQDPNVKIASGKHFVREVAIGSVKKRILEGKTKGRPWNCLELATHVEDGLRPAFLANEDTRLLTKLKLEDATKYAGRRSYPQGYKEVEKWALLAESGALTEPHQDSHGYSTYITVNQGMVGFGWLSYPSAEDRQAWISDSESIPGDRFRYVVIKPGQTVFFPAGTVHFVFRLPSAGHTLAFGGHVLRCSNIAHWARCLLEEKTNTHITNEDLTNSAPGYLNRVEQFVVQAQKNGTLEKWGGAEAVGEFLRLKREFMAD
jgi:hypothetical protein